MLLEGPIDKSMTALRHILVFLNLAIASASLSAAEVLTPEDLSEDWHFYGIGSHHVEYGSLFLSEDVDSRGAMLLSPHTYIGDFKVSYEIMPMNAATVCVLILCATDPEDPTALTISDDYDGNIQYWVNDADNYLFAYHNSSHGKMPFVNRRPIGGQIGVSEKRVAQLGRFNQIEAGKEGGKLWLKVNGELLFETEDTQPFESGHFAFRIRGIRNIPAACMIRNIVIEGTKGPSILQ